MSGAAVWLVVAPVVSQIAPHTFTSAEVLIGAAVCAGWALFPDLDQPSSTIARSFGPVSWVVSKLVNAVSAAWYNLTRTSLEPASTDGHRKLTHSLLGMILVAAGVGAITGAFGEKGALGVLFIAVGLAIRGLMGDWVKKNGWLVTTAAAAAATWAAAWLMPPGNYWWLAITALVGQIVHGLGDNITKQGVPWLGGVVRVRGKRWWDFALPGFMRITTGGAAEGVLMTVFTVVVVGGVLAVFAGGWAQLGAVFGVGAG